MWVVALAGATQFEVDKLSAKTIKQHHADATTNSANRYRAEVINPDYTYSRPHKGGFVLLGRLPSVDGSALLPLVKRKNFVRIAIDHQTIPLKLE